MSSLSLGFVSTNMRKLKNTIMNSTSPRPKRRSEPVVPDKVLAKPMSETTQDFDCIPNDVKQLDDAHYKDFQDDTGVGIVNETQHANTLPRAKTETQMNILSNDITGFARSMSDGSSDVVSITSTTSEKPKVKLRRRISINPSWKAGSRDVRRSRSFNAGSKEMEEKKSTGSPTYMRKRHKPLVVKKVPAKELETSTLSGYLERKCFNGQWVRYWYVLHEGTLFCYLTSDDNVTVDVLNLNGYSVTAMVDKFRGKRFVLQLSHENFTSLYLSMESREELEDWQEALCTALGRPASHVKEAEEDQDNGACAGCESNRRDDVGDKTKKVKQKLLEEVLRQKHELERKQAERQRRQKNKDPESPDRSPDSSFMPDFMAEDTQRLSDVTRLRQRRMSTQLKMDTIQKQVHTTSNPKRGFFGFGKQKKLDENKNVFLQDQLKELSDKLNRIDTDLSQVEQDKIIDTFDVNQNKQQIVGGFNSVEGINMDNSDVFENDNYMGRTNSIKSKMQKLTNKQFGKSSVKNKKRSKSPQTIVHNSESMPDLTLKQNGDIINGHNYDSSHDVSTEDCLSSDNSVTDLTRPADLPLDLASSHNGSNSPTSLRYDRSNSRSSTLSNFSSPRREINPSVLAEIDAFEELSRQVLSARSKEMPAK